MKTIILALALLATACIDQNQNTQKSTAAVDLCTCPCPPDAPIPDAPPPDAVIPPDASPTSCITSWTPYRNEFMTHGVTSGVLWINAFSVNPNVHYDAWFNSDEAAYLYQNVTGNFKITAIIHTRKHTDHSVGPDPHYQYAGLMARNPASNNAGAENHVHVVLGRAGSTSTFDVESKNTQNNSSWPILHANISVPDAELRLCRVGNIFRTYYRAIGATTWIQTSTNTRNDLNIATLQVGPSAYSAWWNPNVEGRYDCITIEETTTLADCLTD